MYGRVDPPALDALSSIFVATYGRESTVPESSSLIVEDIIATFQAAMRTQFAVTFEYDFDDFRSQPPGGVMIAAGEDAIFFETDADEITITEYFQTVTADALPATDAITLANDLTAIVRDGLRSAAPISKPLRLALSQKEADCFMISSASSSTAPSGVMLFVYGFVVHRQPPREAVDLDVRRPSTGSSATPGMLSVSTGFCER